MKKNNDNEQEINEGVPICEKCGNAKVQEGDDWICSHCDTEIDFFGEDDE